MERLTCRRADVEASSRDDGVYMQVRERDDRAEDDLYEEMAAEGTDRSPMIVLLLVGESGPGGLLMGALSVRLQAVTQRMQDGRKHPSGQKDGQQKTRPVSNCFLHRDSMHANCSRCGLTDRHATGLFRHSAGKRQAAFRRVVR